MNTVFFIIYYIWAFARNCVFCISNGETTSFSHRKDKLLGDKILYKTVMPRLELCILTFLKKSKKYLKKVLTFLD